MSYYYIAQLNVHDWDEYRKYESGFFEIFQKYQGEVLAADNDASVPEGEWGFSRLVLLKFPSKELAESWHQSDAYQSIMKIRHRASDAVMVGVEGLEMRK